MRVDKIHFEELFPTGIYANQRLRAEVSLIEGESAMEAFKLAKDTVHEAFHKLNPQEQRGTYVVPVSDKGLEQKPILMKELEDAKTTEEITIIYNEAPAAVKSDQEFFEAVIKAKQRIKQHTIKR